MTYLNFPRIEMTFGQYSNLPRHFCCPGVGFLAPVSSSARCFLSGCCMEFEKPVPLSVREIPHWRFSILIVGPACMQNSLTMSLLDMSDIENRKPWDPTLPGTVRSSKVLRSEWIQFHLQKPAGNDGAVHHLKTATTPM